MDRIDPDKQAFVFRDSISDLTIAVETRSQHYALCAMVGSRSVALMGKTSPAPVTLTTTEKSLTILDGTALSGGRVLEDWHLLSTIPLIREL